jgi:hypothetical protein
MAERGQLLYLDGSPSETDVAAAIRAVGARAAIVAPPDHATIVTMNTWFGRDRTADMHYWSSLGAVAVTVGEPAVGIGFVCPSTPWVPDGSSTRLGPIATAPGATDSDAIATVLGVLAAALTMPDREPVVRLVIGEVHPAVAPLQALGFAVTDRDTYLASDDAIFDLRRCLGAADLW